jgi:iron complex outermembrane receptor protein
VNDEIVVTGTNIRGVENLTVPMTTLNKAYIEATGISTTAGLIESIPQNFALASQSRNGAIPNVSSLERGSSINLRGIGEGTTLTLLNGRRLALGGGGSAADVSSLPLSAIDRVEVLTDGASALYGSDAVGGVVNFVLKDNFKGAETRVRTGLAKGGIAEHRISQSFGDAWESGNFVVSGEYYHRDVLLSSDRDFVPSTVLDASILPGEDNFSFAIVGRQNLTNSVSIFAHALLSRRKSFNGQFPATTTLPPIDDEKFRTDQAASTAGLTWNVGSGWQMEIAGSYGLNDTSFEVRDANDRTLPPFFGDSLFQTISADFKADGPLFHTSGGTVRAAIGASWRRESYARKDTQSGATITDFGLAQNVSSLFGELSIPLVGATNSFSVVQRLEISIAARYDSYSRSGNSFDPRIGIAWEPLKGARLRASYGTSYVAPRLTDFNATGQVIAQSLADPQGVGSPPRSNTLGLFGVADDLGPQRSNSFSAGIDFKPSFAAGLRVSLGYFDIRYSDQIANPAGGSRSVILRTPETYGALITRNPSLALVNQYITSAQATGTFVNVIPNFNPSLITVIVDARRRNLAKTRAEGLDFGFSYEFSAQGSDFRFGADGVYNFRRDQQVTSTAGSFDTIDTIYNPTDLRVRSSAGWTKGSLSANLFGNYTDSYTDNRITPYFVVSSYVTVDANLSFKPRQIRGILSNSTISINAINLFDQDPPRLRTVLSTETGFDPTNSNPMGRVISLEFVKRW